MTFSLELFAMVVAEKYEINVKLVLCTVEEVGIEELRWVAISCKCVFVC